MLDLTEHGEAAADATTSHSTTLPPEARVKPELLAPAGDRTCMLAAVENGADAVYFGLQRHNARIRAQNFEGSDLPETMALLHRRGVRGYVTLNTLVFTSELPEFETTVREVAEAGVDAVIIQDLGLARLIRAITPDLEIHASTQMSITSAEGVRLAEELGCSRVILARELSLAEIGTLRRETKMPLEVFVHGALCVAYSGQCLTSEALGGRSANRGECAQACRMPYEIICDGREIDLGRTRFLLSPQDLAAYDLVPRLIELGVSSLKIEGRLKAPEYVASITRHYRQAIDEAWAGRPVAFAPRDVEEMQLMFSRGFSHGFLDGNNHKLLVRGDYAKKRGLFLGQVESVVSSGVRLSPTTAVKPGDGLVFDGDETTELPEQGGRVFEVLALRGGRTELRFGRGAIDPGAIRPGQGVWKTDDPEVTARIRRSFEGPSSRLVAVDLAVLGHVGQPLRIEARSENGHEATVESPEPLAAAVTTPSDEGLLREQLGRMGGTLYRLRELDVRLSGSPMIPRSLLNQLRREVIARLDEAAVRFCPRAIAASPALPDLMAPILAERECDQLEQAVELSVLCRRTEQIEAAVALGVRSIYADYQDIKQYGEAVAAARRGGASILLATPRIEKPGEANLFRFLAKQGADGLLVRNAGGIDFCTRLGIPFVADFSLNAANPLAVALLRQRGARRVVASYDLNASQLLDLIAAVPPGWLELVIHQRIPMFHMEHCVFCAFLSPGTDHTNCGRPCDHHDVRLRDRVGAEHPLTADVGCRNTLFNAVPQTAAEYLTRMVERGARRFRIEFLHEHADEVRHIMGLYHDAFAGRRDGKTLWRALKASNQYGVTRGPLNVL
jgi:putative protease